MPRQSDPSRKPRPRRAQGTVHPSRATNERQRSITQAVGADEERLYHALSKVDARTGAAVVSHLGQQVGNTALHRLLIHCTPMRTDVVKSTRITFGSNASASDFTSSMRAALEAILRAAGAHSAEVVRIGRKQDVSFFDVAPGSVDRESALVSAAEAEVGNRLVCFLRPPQYPGYHFEIHH